MKFNTLCARSTSRYGRGFLIRRKNQILFARKEGKGQLIDVSETGKNLRKYVRI